MLNFLGDSSIYREKEQIYIRVRNLEKRIYSDNEVKLLPVVPPDHPLKNEWKIRAATFSKLKKRIAARETYLSILDIGCGNGWMSNRLSEIGSVSVTGIDVNQFELEQASRVFESRGNLKFIYGNVLDNIFPVKTFDIIVLAASIQYFPDLKKLISELLFLLKSPGEIHIIDSPVYKENDVTAARKRSDDYYMKLGVQEMSGYYFHHHWNELSGFSYCVLNRSLADRIKLHLLHDRSLVLPWIMVQK